MKNFWLDKKKKQQDETLSFADDTSKMLFWNNKDNHKKKQKEWASATSRDWWEERHNPNNDERLEGHGLESDSDPRPTAYSAIKLEGLTADVEALLKGYVRFSYRLNDTATLGLVQRLQRYINNGRWHMIEDRIMGRANLIGRPINQGFCDKLKHHIVKLQTEEKQTLRQQTLMEKLIEKVAPAEYATESDRFEHESIKRPYIWNLVQDIDLIRKYYRHLDGLAQLTKLTTEDIKFAWAVERVQGHLEDGNWHYYTEYLIGELCYSEEWCSAFRKCIANIPSSYWRDISRKEVNEQRLAKQKTV